MRVATRLAVGLFLVAGASQVGHGEAGGDTPEAVYEECQKLQTAIEEADAEIRRLEHDLDRQRKAEDNYQYVREQNATMIARLEQWVESE